MGDRVPEDWVGSTTTIFNESHLGFNRDVSDSELQSWVTGQNVEEMLGAMHAISVEPGDSVYVPPGLPHAIGSGVFLVEVQEPEDLSILLEWQGFTIDGVNEGQLGLGFETALMATDRRGYSEANINELVVRQGGGASTLAQGSESYFRAESYKVDRTLTLVAGFCILVATSGQGSMRLSNGEVFPVSKGDTLMVAHNEGSFLFEGELSVVCCRPPV